MNFNTALLRPLNFWQFILANIVLSFLILVLFMNGALSNRDNFMIGMVWSFAICTTQWIGPVLINKVLDKRVKWVDHPIKRTFLELATLIMWSVTAFVIVQSTMYYIVKGMTPMHSWAFIKQSIVLAFLISLFISLVFTSIGFFSAWRKLVLREADLKLEVMRYKYESLRNQLNPHFLYNSFNVLSDLVYDDQQQAVKFIRQLSDLFRYVLESNEIVTLKQELDFIRGYTYLLKTRFNDKLHINIEVEDSEDHYLIPMTLQLLVENAVKHNEISEKYPLNVTIRLNGDYIEVENSVKKKKTIEKSNKVGLRNIRQQLGFSTKKELEVIPGDESFLVRVPLIDIVEHYSKYL